MFHYSFSAPLQAVTEIMKNKDAAVLVSAAWRWAPGGQRTDHGPAPRQPLGAAPGRTHPAGPHRQLRPPSPAPSAPSATTHPAAAPAGPLPRGGSEGQGTAPTPSRWGRGGQGPSEPGAALQGQLWDPHGPPGPRPLLAERGTPRWARSPLRGCSPHCPQPVRAGCCCWRGREGGPQPGLSHPSVPHSGQRVRPEQPIRAQKCDAQPSGTSCRLTVQKQKTLPRYHRPRFPATLHSSSPYCSFYCNYSIQPRRERKRGFVFPKL